MSVERVVPGLVGPLVKGSHDMSLAQYNDKVLLFEVPCMPIEDLSGVVTIPVPAAWPALLPSDPLHGRK